MRIEISKKEIRDIQEALRNDLSSKNDSAMKINMCLRDDFVEPRKRLIRRFENLNGLSYKEEKTRK